MKLRRIALVLGLAALLLALPATGQARTIVWEDFASFLPPPGWSVQNEITECSPTWQFDEFVRTVPHLGHIDQEAAFLNSLAYTNWRTDSRLISDEIDMSPYANARLHFDSLFFEEPGYDDLLGTVYVTDADGDEVALAVNEESHVEQPFSYDISDAADDNPAMQLGFHFDTTAGTSGVWMVDNVCVTAECSVRDSLEDDDDGSDSDWIINASADGAVRCFPIDQENAYLGEISAYLRGTTKAAALVIYASDETGTEPVGDAPLWQSNKFKPSLVYSWVTGIVCGEDFLRPLSEVPGLCLGAVNLDEDGGVLRVGFDDSTTGEMSHAYDASEDAWAAISGGNLMIRGVLDICPADTDPGEPEDNVDEEALYDCDNSCPFNNDGVCDDGGECSELSLCDYGTDCSDCGPRAKSTGDDDDDDASDDDVADDDDDDAADDDDADPVDGDDDDDVGGGCGC
ncbi:hypothetical protein KDL45_07175 [bacterium]|nr:hypothetical protein [bacterium]